VALIEGSYTVSQSVYGPLSQCFGPWPSVHEHVLSGPPPTSPQEATQDALNVASIAPRARIDMFETGAGTMEGAASLAKLLPGLIYAALNPANTGGKLVDTISISYGACEASFTPAEVGPVETALKRAEQLGVAVFVAGGDEGSALAYKPNGASTCVPAGNPVATQRYGHSKCGLAGAPGLTPGNAFPASSPFVTAVGGTELQLNGAVPQAGSSAGGTVTDEPVWNERAPANTKNKARCGWPFLYYAGGGGPSRMYTTDDAPWQKLIGLRGAERKPDIAALAGSPEYLGGRIGTSGGAPLMAGAVAVLDGYLLAHRMRTTGPLNPLLYRIGAQPKLYRQVFNDIVHGDNDLLGVRCCSARHGFDEASGLGSLNIAGLAHVLSTPGQLKSSTG
jgi:subtilase family serine protease